MWVGRGILLHTGMQASKEPVSFHLRTSPLSRASESSTGFLFFFHFPFSEQTREKGKHARLSWQLHRGNLSHRHSPIPLVIWPHLTAEPVGRWSVHIPRRKLLGKWLFLVQDGHQCVSHNRWKKKVILTVFPLIISKVGTDFHFYYPCALSCAFCQFFCWVHHVFSWALRSTFYIKDTDSYFLKFFQFDFCLLILPLNFMEISFLFFFSCHTVDPC